MTELEQRLLPLVVEIARGDLADDDQGDYCLYCGIRHSPYLEDKEPEHELDCFIPRARAILREIGQPMKLFRFTWEYFYDRNSHMDPRWVKMDYSFYAQDASGFDSEQFLLERYTPPSTARLKQTVPPLRNKTLVLVREV